MQNDAMSGSYEIGKWLSEKVLHSYMPLRFFPRSNTINQIIYSKMGHWFFFCKKNSPSSHTHTHTRTHFLFLICPQLITYDAGMNLRNGTIIYYISPSSKCKHSTQVCNLALQPQCGRVIKIMQNMFGLFVAMFLMLPHLNIYYTENTQTHITWPHYRSATWRACKSKPHKCPLVIDKRHATVYPKPAEMARLPIIVAFF